MPKSWTTKDQLAWLNARKNDFLEAKKQDIIISWLDEVNEMWFVDYPEFKACFPSKDENDVLTAEEEAKLNAAIKTRKGQLSNWFRYHANTGESSRKTSAISQFLKLLQSETKGLTRAPHACEVYKKLFESKVEEEYQRRKHTVSTAIEICNLKRSIATEFLKSDTPAVQQRVREQIEEFKKDRVEKLKNKIVNLMEKKDRTPEEYQNALDEMPAFLGTSMNALAEACGWTIHVLAGGPRPINNGKLWMVDYQFGNKTAEGGNEFGVAYVNFKQNVKDPFSKYLAKCYLPHVRNARALNLNVTSQETEGNATCIEEEVARLNEEDLITASAEPVINDAANDSFLNRLSQPPASPVTVEIDAPLAARQLSQPPASPVTVEIDAPLAARQLSQPPASPVTVAVNTSNANVVGYEVPIAAQPVGGQDRGDEESNGVVAAGSNRLPSNQLDGVVNRAEGDQAVSHPHPDLRNVDGEAVRTVPGGPNESIEWAFLRMSSGGRENQELMGSVQIDPALLGHTHSQALFPLTPPSSQQPVTYINGPGDINSLGASDYTLPTIPPVVSAQDAAGKPPAKRGRPKKLAQGPLKDQSNTRSTRSTRKSQIIASEAPNTSEKSGRQERGTGIRRESGPSTSTMPASDKTSRKRVATSDIENVNAKSKRKWKGYVDVDVDTGEVIHRY